MSQPGTEAIERGVPDDVAGLQRAARKIILFSDGTGNSSGKLFKTNVWRLYEALDLGPAGPDQVEQIAYYSNGVGTSGFRPLALLGGIFGIGLKANILDLYKYLCRNWMPGDEIYLFGFSRGAFTIRLLSGLITHQGVLRGDAPDHAPDEDKLAYLSRAAYRSFSGAAWPNRWPAKAAARVFRAIRNAALELHRRATGRLRYDPAHNCMTDIHHVGVWDTVAAYGGPIIEITRGIDDWIWPLTMPNYELSPRVLRARHALALDDERDAFQPLLWDEVREDMLVRWGGAIRINSPEGILAEEVRQVSPYRLKQVWFAGMHADVGGGYPDESLSFVSLLWMIDELDGTLRLLPEAAHRIASMANVHGPIHNSRAGLGGYYRYQPRRITALVDWRQPIGATSPGAERDRAEQLALAASTRSMRDPEIADPEFSRPPFSDRTSDADLDDLEAHIREDHGLLTAVRVHESVIARVVAGTDNYAPVSLPRHFDIVFAKRTGLSQRVLDAFTAKRLRDERRRRPNDGQHSGWFSRQAEIWDMVWRRRVQYFATAFASILLVSMPLWDQLLDGTGVPRLCSDARCIARPFLGAVDTVTFGISRPFTSAYADNLLVALVLLGSITLLFAASSAYDLRLRSAARRAWRIALGLDDPRGGKAPARRGMAQIRERHWYQRGFGMFKWVAAPMFFGWGILLAGGLLLAALACQVIALPLIERSGRLCALDMEAKPGGFILDTSKPCTASGMHVEPGKPYTISVTVTHNAKAPPALADGWFDDDVPASPAAEGSADLPWYADVIGAPFRRVTLAGWQRPMIGVLGDAPPRNVLQRLLGPAIDIERLDLVCDPISGSYVGQFTPEVAGSLNLFTNDAAPFGSDRFYRNNHGRAVVQVWRDTKPPAFEDGELQRNCLDGSMRAPVREVRKDRDVDGGDPKRPAPKPSPRAPLVVFRTH